MQSRKLPIAAVVIAFVSIVTLGATRCQAQSETVIFSFSGKTLGEAPNASPLFDSSGNIYSTQYVGGSKDFGTVVELTSRSGGGFSTSILHNFLDGNDGANSTSNLIMDAKGNLYGTAQFGGDKNPPNCTDIGCGVVFELSPNGSGSWNISTLHIFRGGNDGVNPSSGLVMDQAGNLYGTTPSDGPNGKGIVFELSPSSGGTWKETILYSFKGLKDGNVPNGGVILDSAGNLYGTTLWGGNASDCVPRNQGGCGVVYKLSPKSGGGWQETVLHTFSGADGAAPQTALAFDQAGNLYGNTVQGGDLSACVTDDAAGCGVVFELSPVSGGWHETVLYAFTGEADGASPSGTVLVGKSDTIYGTTTGGGNSACFNGCGVVFELSRNSSGKWQENVLHSFSSDPDGGEPAGGVVFGPNGDLYGTTAQGGSAGEGAIFTIQP